MTSAQTVAAWWATATEAAFSSRSGVDQRVQLVAENGVDISELQRNRRDPDSEIWLLPPSHLTFNAFFLRSMYSRMEKLGYTQDGRGIHVHTFRRCMRKFCDMFESKIDHRLFESYGAHRKALYITWNDVRRSIERGELPSIELTRGERIFMVLSGNTNSVVGRLWSATILIAIVANLFGMTIKTLEGDVCYGLIHDHHCSTSMFLISMIFSVDYFGKLFVSPWCRHGILNLDWVIENAVLDPKDPYAPALIQASHLQKTWKYISQPMYIVDILAIVPFLMQMLGRASHKSLGVLRSLRLFRLFRILKFGKFSRVLLVLGSTFGRSASSISVIVLYMLMISLMSGAILAIFEAEAGNKVANFQDMPRMMWWVSCRVVGMQQSLPGADGTPITAVGCLVIIFVGVLKGVLFVLPVGQISQAFKTSWDEELLKRDLQAEVDRQKVVPAGFDWAEDPMTPIARIDFHDVVEGNAAQHFVGNIPLPLYLEHKVDCTFWVHVRRQLRAVTKTELLFQLQWHPFPDTNPGEKRPHGVLKLRLMEGRGFTEHADHRWVCNLSIPLRLHGECNMSRWSSPPSDRDSPLPLWREPEELTFEIGWGPQSEPVKGEQLEGADRGSEAPTVHSAPSETRWELQQRVLQMLQDQSVRMAKLEQEIRDDQAGKGRKGSKQLFRRRSSSGGAWSTSPSPPLQGHDIGGFPESEQPALEGGASSCCGRDMVRGLLTAASPTPRRHSPQHHN